MTEHFDVEVRTCMSDGVGGNTARRSPIQASEVFMASDNDALKWRMVVGLFDECLHATLELHIANLLEFCLDLRLFDRRRHRECIEDHLRRCLRYLHPVPSVCVPGDELKLATSR
jgi:hypothetical protein